MIKRISMDKKGVSTILVVGILVVAVVVAAGAYIVLKNNNDDAKEGNAQPIMGNLGVGSMFFYYEDKGTASVFEDNVSVAAIPTAMRMIVEVIGEDAEYYFLKVSWSALKNELTTLKMHKTEGKIEGADKVDDTWVIDKTLTDGSEEAKFTLKVTIYEEYGPMISNITIKGTTLNMVVNIDTSKNDIVEPTPVTLPEFMGKYSKYSFDMEAEITEAGIKGTAAMNGSMETKISGSAGDKMLIESKVKMTLKLKIGDAAVRETIIEYTETYASDYAYEIPDGAVFGEQTVIEYEGASVNVIKVEYDFSISDLDITCDMVAYVDVDKPVMYEATTDMKTGGVNIVIVIKLEESNF